MSTLTGSSIVPGAMYVQALYDYEADDRTSLSFRQGDTIQVITQLESGWWDGVIRGTRGWFPSNYCAVIAGPGGGAGGGGGGGLADIGAGHGLDANGDFEDEYGSGGFSLSLIHISEPTRPY